MKLFTTLIFFLAFTAVSYSQKDVFVLVDVSKSISQQELNDARQALYEVLTGAPLTKAFVKYGKQQDLPGFKLMPGDKFAVSKFGSLNTTLAINPQPVALQNVATDVNQQLNSIDWKPADQQTYITLAKAKIAEYAKNHQIGKYKLYVVSDNIQDDYGKSGKPTYPDDYTRNLAEDYNSSGNPVTEAGFTKLKFSANSNFAISLVPEVDVTKYKLPSSPPPIPPDTTDKVATITITSPPKTKKENEYELNSENLSVNWTCNNCPQGVKYKAMVTQYDGGNFRQTQNSLTSNAAIFKLPDGKFKITISASNYPAASSDVTFVSVSTTNLTWLLLLLILIVLAWVGYYFWNKKRQDKITNTSSNRTDDIFSSSSGSSTSDYF